jgi:PAS domain S-box-containing protein
MLRFDGTHAYVAVNDAPTLWQGKQAIIVAVQDETQQRLADEQARLMEARLKQAVDALPMGFAVWDEEERLLVWNRWFEQRIAKPLDLVAARGLPRATILEKASQRVSATPAEAAAWVETATEFYTGGEGMGEIMAAGGRTLSVARRRTEEGHVICVYDDVTKRKQSEIALRQSEARYRQMIDLLPVAICTIINGNVVYANSAAVELHGVTSPADLIGEPVVEFYDPDDAPRLMQKRREVLASEKSGTIHDLRLNRRDGLVRYVNSTGVKVLWDGNDAILAIMHDMTERREHIEALRQSEERYRTLVELMPDGVIVSQAGKVSFINSAGVRLCGGERPEDIIGRPVLDFVHADWRDAIIQRMATKSAMLPAIEHQRVRLDGSTYWAEGTGSDAIWHGGLGRLVVVRDITRYKDSEAKLRDANHTLEAFIESSPVPIFRVDRDARVTLWNAAAERVTGWTAAEAMGNPVPYLTDDLEHERGAMLKAATDVKRPIVREARRRRRDGTPVDYLTYAAPLINEQKEITGIVVQLIDITERNRGEQALREAKEAAELANRTKSEFLANMSHELRTPLNAVIGFSELMLSEMLGPLGNDRYREYVRDIRQSGTHLLGLINDILDLSKIEAGKVELEEATFDPAEAIAATLRIIRERAQQRRIALAAPRINPSTKLRADERRVKQILLNLLSNAVKFTPEGGSVTVTGEWRTDGLVIAVSDTGIGIAPEDVPLALEPFRQISSAHNRSYEGTGLGLPLTKRLVELHGGTLEIDSAVGQGTTVRVQFPPQRLVA